MFSATFQQSWAGSNSCVLVLCILFSFWPVLYFLFVMQTEILLKTIGDGSNRPSFFEICIMDQM